MKNNVSIYLGKDSHFIVAIENTEQFEKEIAEYIGTTIEDIENDKVVKLNDEQIAFLSTHKNLPYKDIINMTEPPLEDKVNEVKETREKAYVEQSDSLYMAYLKYKDLGQEEKAKEAHDLWLSKINEISNNNPYPTV